MATAYDVQPMELIERLAKELENDIDAPEWSLVVKTGPHKQRPPHQSDWWYIRAAAVLRAIYMYGPIGTQKLRRKYGGRKNRGSKPEQFRKGSGSVIRKVLQGLQSAGYIELSKHEKRKGRIISAKGRKLVDNTAHAVMKNSPVNAE